MKELTIHNLKAGWRNILKYKTQNIISIVCLSFGVLCFAIALYWINVVWCNYGRGAVMQDRTTVSFFKDYYPVYLKGDEIVKIKQLPMVKTLSYKTVSYALTANLKDKKGTELATELRVKYITPNWLKEHNFYSDITGKKIEDLKPGTVVMERRAAKQRLGDLYSPSDFNGYVTDKYGNVSDVVYSPTYSYTVEEVLIVLANDKEFDTHEMDVVLNDGYTLLQFKEALEKALPEYNPSVRINSSDRWAFGLFMLFLVCLGGSVLVIGMSGYLKMQLQLFLLRTREMSLRRCNGAKPYQLFMLLCAELAIVFAFVSVVSLAISAAFEAYAMPRLKEFGLINTVDMETSIIYHTELWVVLFAFLAAVAIAWITVRRSLKSPLAKTVGRSFTQRTLWNGTMQVVQYSTAVMLFYLISLLFYAMHKNAERYDLPDKPDYYKNIVSTGSLPAAVNTTQDKIRQQMAALPSVELYAQMINVECDVWEKDDSCDLSESLSKKQIVGEVPEDTINNYKFIVADVNALKMFHVGVNNEFVSPPFNYIVRTFAKPEKLDEIKDALGLNYKTDTTQYQLIDGKKYVSIGFAQQFPQHKINYYSDAAFLIIDDCDSFLIPKSCDELTPNAYYYSFAKAKDNDVDALQKDIDGLWHKIRPEVPEDAHITLPTFYDMWLVEFKIIDFITQLMYLLTIVCLTSIVLTVYSSISLETRGKRKEVAIRKVNGAKVRDIVMLFSRYYIVTLSISFAFAALVGLIVLVGISMSAEMSWPDLDDFLCVILPPFLFSIVVITTVTIATVWQKISKIAHVSPAETFIN